MKRTRVLLEIRQMRFADLYEGWQIGRLSQQEAAEALGVSDRTFRRFSRRFEEDGANGLLGSAPGAGVGEAGRGGRSHGQRRQQHRAGEHQPVQPRAVNEMFSRQQISIDVAHRSRGTAPTRATFSLGASRGGVLNRDLGGPDPCTRHETPPGTRCAPRSRCC